jgi:hypothetical protein
MPRKNLDQERWEAYFMMILLAMRPFLFVGAVILFLYTLAAFFAYPLISVISLGFALFLLFVVFFDQGALWIARIGAWIATVGRNL